MKKKTSRRKFIKQSSVSLGGLIILPRHVLGGNGFVSPNDKINIAGIGVGGKGYSNLQGASGHNVMTGRNKENVVALCDVNWKVAEQTVKMFPKAKKFEDYRIMLDEMEDQIDAVMVSTPDHMHAVQAIMAMKKGKHVYVEKPLTHDVFEARMLTEAAEKYNVVTQMGNQGSSSDDIRKICEWIWSGVIGEVKEVHAWTNRPIWEQGLYRPEETMEVPDHLNWDLWLGTAPERSYHEMYQPFSWRGWWDFGTGALGDMACHILDPAVRALKLKYPSAVQAFAPFRFKNWNRIDSLESPPMASTIHFEFPEREEMPAVKLVWYDGGLMPPRPDELPDDEAFGDWSGGVLFIGSKGKLQCGCYASNPRLIPESKQKQFKEPDQSLTRVKEKNHQRNWIAAIRGEAEASSSFDYAGPFSEIVLMGNLALRSLYIQDKVKNRRGEEAIGYPGVGIKLRWDGDNMKILNFNPANQFVKREYREGYSL